jgi:hypothetical protein
MNTNDNSSFQMKSEEPEKEPETEEDVFTSENESDQVFTNDDIRQQPKTDANDMFTTIVSSKDEVIGVLRESLDRAERENVHLRKTNEEMAAYNRELSKMNFMLVAPDKARYGESVYREEPEEPIDVEAEVITPDPPKERRDEHENRQEPENEHHEERQQGDGGENENHQTHW